MRAIGASTKSTPRPWLRGRPSSTPRARVRASDIESSTSDSFLEREPLVDSKHKTLDLPALKDENARLRTQVLELQALIEETEGLCEVLDDVDVEGSFWKGFKSRAGWLVGLLMLQSLSSFILAGKEEMLAAHPIIVYFLTMLVGAGGNAGNQSAVRIIRGLAVGAVNDETVGKFLRREVWMALAITATLVTVGSVRVVLFHGPGLDTVVIGISLALIVSTSIIIGALLPLALHKMRVDAAHAGTSIQVLMDILGVSVTCGIAGILLGTTSGAPAALPPM